MRKAAGKAKEGGQREGKRRHVKRETRAISLDIRTGEDAVVNLKRLGAQINPDSSSRKAITPITSTAVAVAIESDGSSR